MRQRDQTAPPGSCLLAERLAALRARVRDAAISAGRDPADVTILLATKTQSAPDITAAIAAGFATIGENRVQELVAKAPVLAEQVAHQGVHVHFIGALQRNKVTALLATGIVSTVQSVDSLRLAETLSARCLDLGRTLDVMVQVNVSGESSKSGIEPHAAIDLALATARLGGLRLTGLMTIARHVDDEVIVRRGFATLRALGEDIAESQEPGTDAARELSMGMSTDLAWAIAEGATLVRVGSAAFGARR